MKPEHDERFRRIAEDYLARPGGYGELLRHGQVSSPEGVDPEDAARQRSIPKDRELAELTVALEQSEALRGLDRRAERLGHEIGRWLRHDDEGIVMCTRCPARIYVRFDGTTPVVDGEAIDDPCPA